MKEVEVEPVDPARLEGWDGWLDAAGCSSVFHRAPFLRAMARHSGSRLAAMTARIGGEVVALYPAFLSGGGPLRVLESPPPRCAVPDLGPVLLGEPASPYERETRWGAISRAFEAFIRAEFRPSGVRVTLGPALADPRPLQWSGYRVEPRFTYEIDLAGGAERVFASFRSQVRTDARRATRYPELEIVDGGPEHLAALVRRVRERYAEQGRAWGPSEGYFAELLRELPPGTLAVKAAMADGEMVSGLGLLAWGGTVRHWIGGTATSGRRIGVNELLHWRAVEQYAAAGFTTYEMMGANTEHLCRHKSRYNPRLVPYYAAERATGAARASAAVRALRGPRAAARRLLGQLRGTVHPGGGR